METSVVFQWNFANKTRGWKGSFADYPADQENIFELDQGVRNLPRDLGGEPSLFISGSNRSDDLFMYFRRFVTGLTPNTTYTVDFQVQFASDAPDGSVGIGGSPANSVYVKAGATLEEPLPVPIDGSQGTDLLMNIDKGVQSRRGRDSVVLGDVAKSPGDDSFTFDFVQRRNFFDRFVFTTDDTGSAWLYFGTDSGFEGVTSLFYTNFRAEFVPASQAGKQVWGTAQSDELIGTSFNDLLSGRRESDQLTGGDGADWFLYRGLSERQTFAQSRLETRDVITDFNPAEGDRLALDFKRNQVPDLPDRLFFAGSITATTLQEAITLACGDRAPAQPNAQRLQEREAVFLEWEGTTFLVVNDEQKPFKANRDLVIELPNFSLPSSAQSSHDGLSVREYFVDFTAILSTT